MYMTNNRSPKLEFIYNYISVSNSEFLSKIIEKVVAQQLISSVQDNPLNKMLQEVPPNRNSPIESTE